MGYDNTALGTFHVHGGCTRLKVKGSITASIDDIAVIDTANGYLTKGSAATGLKFVGTFAENVDTTGKSNGDPYGPDELEGPQVNLPEAPAPRAFWLTNSDFAQADMGKAAYIDGARAASKDSTGRSKLGTAIQLSADATKVRVVPLPLGYV